MTNAEGEIIWRANMSHWGKTLRETTHHEESFYHVVAEQNLPFQGQYLLHQSSNVPFEQS